MDGEQLKLFIHIVDPTNYIELNSDLWNHMSEVCESIYLPPPFEGNNDNIECCSFTT